jgi:predicted nucleic acid-binding protein
MDILFLETSALVKRYQREIKGTERVLALTDPGTGNDLYISDLTRAEVPGAILKKYRRGEVRLSQAQAAIQAFFVDVRSFINIIHPTPDVIDDAIQLIGQYPLMAYDAIQIASALHCDQVVRSVSSYRVTFIAADRQVLNAAESEGLLVENPEDY